jgi:ribosomal protein S5
MSKKNKEDSIYLSTSEEINKFKSGVGGKEKAIAALKIIGKGIINTGKFVAHELTPAMEKAIEKKKRELEKENNK